MAMTTVSTKNAVGTTVTFPVHIDAASNRVSVVSRDTSMATYVYSGTVLVANMAASLTDLIVLRGHATKTVRVKSIKLSGVSTAAATQLVQIKKHTVANLTGTSTNPTPTQLDSGDSAAGATILLYTANAGTIDASATTVASKSLQFAAVAAGLAEEWTVDLVQSAEHGLVLRGIAQECAINFGGTTPGAGTVLSFQMAWQEETEA